MLDAKEAADMPWGRRQDGAAMQTGRNRCKGAEAREEEKQQA